MPPITVLWLLDESPPPASTADIRHITADPDRPASIIASLLAEGGVLAVVRTEAEAERAISYGADEVVLASEASGPSFEKIIERTTTRARARFHRDLYLIDLVRKDDTSALALLATALGREIIEPLERAVQQLSSEHPIAETVSGVARVVEQMTQLVGTAPTDEIVDLCQVTRDVTRSLESGVRPAAHFSVSLEERPCPVGLPRWQAAMVVASLVANSVESVSKRGGTDRTVSVSLSRESDAAVLEVADNGVGMDEDIRVHAADPFYTTDSTHLGLGLPLVAARVRRAGGDVIIESDEGVGTTVRVFLPLVGAPPPTHDTN